MKTMTILLTTVCIMSALAFAEDGHVKLIAPEFLLTVMNPEWGSDVAITNREPLGRPSAAGRADGTAFIAVPDTGLVANVAVVVYRTTNFGTTWSAFVGYTPAFGVEKCKMVKASNDSIYLFFLAGGVLRYWNVETLVTRTLDSTGIRDFDVATSANSGMYLFYDLDRNNAIYRAASSDGGATWPQRAAVSTAGAIPRVTMNLQAASDTLFLNYYGPVKTDTARSIIRQARYREVAPGNIASTGFIDVDVDTTNYRTEFLTVKVHSTVWMLNTRGQSGNIDIMCRVSPNSGVSYGAPFVAVGSATADEYWFAAANFTVGFGGLDFAWYSDSISAVPDNQSDKILNVFSNSSSPTTFSSPVRVSEHYPASSPRRYVPTLFEFNDANAEVGIVWVGTDAGIKKVFFDRYYAPAVGVTLSAPGVPEVYSLSQNYPNPFNPTTYIEFQLPKSGFVSLKVYDLLGREVNALVSENLNAGRHKVTMNASNFASGVYLYRLSAGGFIETRKLTLLK